MEITEKEKREVLAKAKEYLKWEKSEVFRKEVEDAIAKNDWDDLYDRFYTALAFGTAGMRGVIGGGTNRINTYMVGRVTQGLSDYLNKNSDTPSVSIAYDSRHWSKEFALYAALVLSANGVRNVEKGIFGADMAVDIANDGPVTIMLDTDIWRKDK